MKRLTCFVIVLATFATFSLKAQAGVINVPVNGSLSGFGPDNYRGQTFIAIPGLLEDLTVYVGESNAIPGPVTYRVLITEVDTSSGIQPTNVLFESSALVTNIGNGVIPPAVTIDIGGLALTTGTKYAWILDAYVELAANPPIGPGGPYPSALVGLNDIFGDNFPTIESLSFNLGPFPTGTREEHFSVPWSTSNLDHAFVMNFAEVSEPAIIALLALGVVAIAPSKRHRKSPVVCKSAN
jgi:hypothetical protein